MLELFCQVIYTRWSLIDRGKYRRQIATFSLTLSLYTSFIIRIGDPDLKEAVMSVLYAEPRTNNLKELAQVCILPSSSFITDIVIVSLLLLLGPRRICFLIWEKICHGRYWQFIRLGTSKGKTMTSASYDITHICA